MSFWQIVIYSSQLYLYVQTALHLGIMYEAVELFGRQLEQVALNW